MCIKRGIKIVKSDNWDDYSIEKIVSWENRDFDFWVSDFLFDLNGERIIQRKWIENETFCCMIPKEVLEGLAQTLLDRKFWVCPDAYEYFDGFKQIENYAFEYGNKFKYLIKIIKENESFLYCEKM